MSDRSDRFDKPSEWMKLIAAILIGIILFAAAVGAVIAIGLASFRVMTNWLSLESRSAYVGTFR